jgi:branched-chain amino acid transport system substrate-binding protein
MKTLTAVALALAGLCLAPSPTQAQFSHDVVKIGVLVDMSGLYADLSGPGSVEAAKMAVEDFGGSVRGHKVEVISADHQNKPDIGVGIARQWIDREGVDAIADVPVSSIALALQEVTRQANRVLLISASGSSDLTGKACSPVSVHWTYDTYALAHTLGSALIKEGGDTWFFLTADYAFGYALERDTAAVVKASGGQVLGSVRHPQDTADFSSFLLQAQASKAKIIGLANAGGDTINSIKQAAEFGLVKGGQRLAGLLVYDSDINSLGLETAQGLVLASAFYWDLDDETRAWGKRFIARVHKVPTMANAGTYGAVLHYLKAMEAANTNEAQAVVRKMKELPINDFFTKNGRVREDGRVIRNIYLFQVKPPGASRYQYDFYNLLATIPGEQAFRPLAEGGCALVKP